MFRTSSPVCFVVVIVVVAIKGNSLKRLPTAQRPLVACKVNLSRARVSEAVAKVEPGAGQKLFNKLPLDLCLGNWS